MSWMHVYGVYEAELLHSSLDAPLSFLKVQTGSLDEQGELSNTQSSNFDG